MAKKNAPRSRRGSSLGMQHLWLSIKIEVAREQGWIYEGLGVDVPKYIENMERELRAIERNPNYRVAEPYGA